MSWSEWHKSYQTSVALLTRLRVVRQQIRAAVDECAEGPVRIVSICAGDGRDVIEALSDHPRREDVTAALLDTDAESLERGRAAAREAGLDRQLHFLCADATAAESYAGMVPADVILISGVMGHVDEANIPHFLGSLPMLCKTGGFLVWNRGLVANRGAEHVRLIRDILLRLEFEERHYEVATRKGFVIGRSRFDGKNLPLDPKRKIFEFVGLDRLLERDETAGEATNGRNSAVPPDREGHGFESLGRAIDIEQSLAACFERKVMLHPQRQALGSGAWQPTYEELNNAANRIARCLLASGTPGDRVAVLMEHDSPLISAVIAVLKLGRMVVVLDQGEPPARLAQVLNDTGPTAIVTDAAHEGLSSQLAAGQFAVFCVDGCITGEPAPNPGIPVSPEAVAFLIYTSGSTGVPKGVMQSHRSILHKSHRFAREHPLQADDKVILLSSLSRGQGVNTVWCALGHGAAVCPFPITRRGVTGLADWIISQGITIFVSAASIFRHFVVTLENSWRFENVRLVWLASESATSEDFAKWQKHFSGSCRMLHTLSSSETGTIAQLILSHDDTVAQGNLPVGRVVEDMEVRLLDENGREVPQGEPGEIMVRSRYLSTGYWGDESLTAKHFSAPDAADGTRTYRGGDRARMTSDGMLFYLGRADSRVNVHGYRVELSEIEEALARESAVERAVVGAIPRPNGDEQLIAYIKLRAGCASSSEMLRQSMRGALPGHMIPAAFVFLEDFPSTPHGKIDRAALRKIVPKTSSNASDEPPRTDTEKRIATVWSELFERNSLSRQDDFFDLGGDSLMAAVTAARIYAEFQVQIDLRTFAEKPTLAELASVVDALHAALPSDMALLPLTPVSRDGPLPLSYNEERIWRFSQTPSVSARYNVATTCSLRGPLQVEVLLESLNFLMCRHEILRTSFPAVEGVPVRRIHPPSALPLPFFDLSDRADAEAESVRIVRLESLDALDLADGPLVRFMLFRLRTDEYHLHSIGHHIGWDAWARDLFVRELGEVYETKLHGGTSEPPEFGALQDADYAVWQRRVIGQGTSMFNAEVTWWEQQLADAPPPLELPFLRPEPLQDVAPREGIIWRDVDNATSIRLNQIARDRHATLFAVRLAAFVALLATETGKAEIILGAYVTNRSRIEIQKMLGDFSNLISLRLWWDERLSFLEWISRVGVWASEFQAHAEIPHEQLCEDLRKRGKNPPEIRAIFGVWGALEPMRVTFGGVEFIRERPHLGKRMPWGFSLYFSQSGEHELCSALFDANLYEPSRVQNFLDRLFRFMEEASRLPNCPLAKLLAKDTATTALKTREPGLDPVAEAV